MNSTRSTISKELQPGIRLTSILLTCLLLVILASGKHASCLGATTPNDPRTSTTGRRQGQGAELAPLGPVSAGIHVLPTLWFRNVWSWGREHQEYPRRKPSINGHGTHLVTSHQSLGDHIFICDHPQGDECKWLFTENDTNHVSFGADSNETPYTKDAFHRHIIDREKNAVNPEPMGTKAAAHIQLLIPPGESVTIRCHHRLVESLSGECGDFFLHFLAY